MSKRLAVVVVALCVAAGLTLAAANAAEGSWTGWITDSHCGAKGDSAKHADCAKKCVSGQGAKWALYNPSDKKVYILDPQSTAEGHAGHYVTVKGTVEGDTIKVTSIEMTPEPKSGGKSGG
jgi:hypothetical protein